MRLDVSGSLHVMIVNTAGETVFESNETIAPTAFDKTSRAFD